MRFSAQVLARYLLARMNDQVLESVEHQPSDLLTLVPCNDFLRDCFRTFGFVFNSNRKEIFLPLHTLRGARARRSCPHAKSESSSE